MATETATSTAGARARRPVIAAALVVGPGAPRRVAGDLAAVLRERLERLSGGVPVRVQLAEEAALGRPQPTSELVEVLRERLLAEGWELAIGVTDVPLRVGRRLVRDLASPLHAVALLSLPALGAGRIAARARDVVLRLVDELLGEEREDVAGGDRGRQRRLARRLAGLRAVGDERGGVGSVLFGGYVRLLAGLIWANEPWRFAARLYRVLIAALAAVAFALVTSDLWLLADRMGSLRLAGLSVVSVAATAASLVVVHDLWERASTPAARAQVALFNLATLATVLIGVLTLYLALFVLTAASAALLLPHDLLRQTLGHPAGGADVAELAWLVSSLATLGGGLGGGLETEATVREAAFSSEANDEAGE